MALPETRDSATTPAFAATQAAPSTRVDEILDVAERFVRTQGYNAFSFRSVAAEVGIKSASVHHHFPTKADLGAAVTRRYAERIFETLGDPSDPAVAPDVLLKSFVAIFRNSLVREKQMCLCGMLGAEIASLPPPVAAEVKIYFERCAAWLGKILSRSRAGENAGDRLVPKQRALTIVATLEGALLTARALDSVEVFDRIAEGITLT